MSKSARGPVLSDGDSRTRVEGFTLVELLVVSSIIAILSIIGMTVFTNVQKSARSDSFFASGKAPTDPGSYIYCAALENRDQGPPLYCRFNQQ